MKFIKINSKKLNLITNNIIIILIIALGSLTLFNIFTSEEESGIRTNLNKIIAQLSGDTFSNEIALQNRNIKIQDNLDRCISINPTTGRPFASIAKSSTVVGKSGINQGGVGDGIETQLNFIKGENRLNRDLGMGYILSIFTGPDVSSAVNFIRKSNENGLMPIVRLCFPGVCNFRMDNDSIPTFYENINRELRSGEEFVGIIGPNEPGTAGEMEAFGVSDYETLFNQVNRITSRLQNIRVINGGKAYISPPVFNITNRQRDDVSEFLIKRNLNASLFDYLIGNTYDSKSINSFNSINDSGLRNFAETNGLQIILSEFGLFDKNSTLTQFKNNFQSLCSDPLIDGILLFRSFEELGRIDGPNPDTLDTLTLASLTTSCARQRPWLNCNFDSAIYPDSPNYIPLTQNSLSASRPSCVVREEITDNSKAGFKIVCSGESCSAKAVKTTRLSLPIKFTGSTSPVGTQTKRYIPFASEVASKFGTIEFDPLNQFAGEVNSGSLRYPMPLLGSIINNSSQLSLYFNEFSRFTSLQSSPNPGSFISNTNKVINNESNNRINNEITYSSGGGGIRTGNGLIKIPDERIIRINDQNADKININEIKTLRQYDPYVNTSIVSNLPASCINNSKMRIKQSSDDMIVGPEVITDKKDVWTGSTGEVCRLYGERNNGVQKNTEFRSSNNINCRVNNNLVIQTDIGLRSCSANVFCNFNQGNCNIAQRFAPCLIYTPENDDDFYIYQKEVTTPQQFTVSKIWDGLYRMRQLLDTTLSTRSLKIVYRENIGWKGTAENIVRDGNRVVQNPEPYLYNSTKDELTFDNGEILGEAFQPELFDNSTLPAKGKNSAKTDLYYDWLGYYDLIQEWRMAYATNTYLSGEKKLTNTFYNTSNGPNKERKDVIIAGTSSKVSSFPLLTCDQIEMCKKKDLLISQLGVEQANELCPYQKIPENAQLTCITEINDNRFEDRLGKELCLRGYKVDNVQCEVYQCRPGENDTSNNQNTLGLNYEDGILSKVIDLKQFDPVGSSPNDSWERIDSFANENKLDLAINTNFATFGIEDKRAPEGLVGGKGVIEYNPTSRGLEGALVFHNGDPTGGDSQIKVIAKTDRLALIQLNESWNSKYTEKIDNLRKNNTIAISGLPILVQNGIKADTSINYRGISNDQSPRTIIGWNSKGELIIAVIKSSDFQGMVDATSKLGIINGIGLDGGGSSQLYSRNGFPTNIEADLLKINNTIYWPGRENESGPRIVSSYLGFRSKSGSINFNNQFASTGGFAIGERINISLTYPTISKEANSLGTYGCNIRRGSRNDQCHTGLDFSLNQGEPVRAAASGKVLYASQDPEGGAYGLSIRIIHPGGASTLYAHLSRLLVTSGQEVKQGEIIGEVGSTGYSTGPHLHFELRRNSTCLFDGFPNQLGRCTLDPTPYLTGQFAEDSDNIPICLAESDFSTPAIPGVLNCSINVKDTSNKVDWAGSTTYLNVFIRSYNLDNNQSFTWIGSRDMKSDAHPSSRDDRIRVTEFVERRAVEKGLSPKFVINLWLEETGGSAIGTKALGCGIGNNNFSFIPFGQGVDAMIAHMGQQVDCLAGVVNKTSNFVEFMCTYSGETPAPGTTLKAGAVRTCNQFTNNPNFPINICKIYSEL